MRMDNMGVTIEALHSIHKDKATFINITQSPNLTTSRNSVPKIPTKLINHHSKHFHQSLRLMSTNFKKFSKKSKVIK